MSRLVIVSNRLPISVGKRGKTFRFQPSIGGLSTGMSSLLKKTYKGIWIGWPGVATEKISDLEKKEIERHLEKNDFLPVFLCQSDVDNYYSGFCNRTLWPLFHYFTQHTVYDKNLWNVYVRVNKLFCDTVLKVIKPGDVIWIHDYHLLLLPQMLRERRHNLTIGFFLHIPFPSFEVFRLLPWRREIIEGLLGADLIGFHTYDYVRHFLDSVRARLGYEHSFGQILIGNRIVKVDTFPMGIDYDRFNNAVQSPDVQKEIEKNRSKLGDKITILSVDRLDYSKGILQRLYSFDRFLEKYSEYKEKVTLILVAVPSRTKVEHYRQLKRDLDELIGRINGKHGTIGWIPVWYLYCSLPFHTLVALYNLSRVALITPLRDGMNLIAKEFIATKIDGKGVLILSEMAGAAKELSEAIIVNPNNMERIADSIYKALTMPEKDQIERIRIMQSRIMRYNVEKWADDFMKNLSSVKDYEHELLARKLTSQMKMKIVQHYRQSNRKLILLDYDGTMISFTSKPEEAKPDKEILTLLKKLSRDGNNRIYIVSGRDKYTLEKWFTDIPVGLVAEHGVWIKEKGGNWELIEPIVNDWKDEIRPILERYVDGTPGSFIEEKDYSLAWHYRKSDPVLASIRALELKDAILYFTSNLAIGVLEGNKVIEVKNAGINKGLVALRFISRNPFDFILAAGDDQTDEDIFHVLPEQAYSIKVGAGPSKARFNVFSVKDIRSLIKKMIEE